MNLLPPSGDHAVEPRGQILEAHARSRGIRIAADHACKSRPIRAAVAQADMHRERAARPRREAVEISRHRQFVHASVALCCVTR